jgi:hypothetical protein
MLNGLAFHVRTGELYLELCSLASPPDGSDPRHDGHAGNELTPLVPDALRAAAGFVLERALAKNGALELHYRRESGARLRMFVALRELDRPAFLFAGPFALSYASGSVLDDDARELFTAVAARACSLQGKVLELIELQPPTQRPVQ